MAVQLLGTDNLAPCAVAFLRPSVGLSFSLGGSSGEVRREPLYSGVTVVIVKTNIRWGSPTVKDAAPWALNLS